MSQSNHIWQIILAICLWIHFMTNYPGYLSVDTFQIEHMETISTLTPYYTPLPTYLTTPNHPCSYHLLPTPSPGSISIFAYTLWQWLVMYKSALTIVTCICVLPMSQVPVVLFYYLSSQLSISISECISWTTKSEVFFVQLYLILVLCIILVTTTISLRQNIWGKYEVKDLTEFVLFSWGLHMTWTNIPFDSFWLYYNTNIWKHSVWQLVKQWMDEGFLHSITREIDTRHFSSHQRQPRKSLCRKTICIFKSARQHYFKSSNFQNWITNVNFPFLLGNVTNNK